MIATSYLEQLFNRKTVSDGRSDDIFQIRIPFEDHLREEAESIMQRSNLKDEDNHNSERIEPIYISRQSKKIKKMEQQQTAGAGWFGMEKQALTPERKNDLLMLKLRGHLDPKRQYKGNDSKKLPNYYQIGTILDGGDEFRSSRIPKGQRKGTLVEQFLQEDKNLNFTKKKFLEVQDKKKQKHRKRIEKFRKLAKKHVKRA
mmetsp:Transcript_18400/g.21187  ORF Transcript_18400/g.21187 Transcript_18400/m.21187 type:complete len:201 (+) Transcript_18400:39-641(+)